VAKGGSVVKGFRLNPKDIEKLGQLADATFRSKSDVLRLLIACADLSGHPDLVLHRPLTAAVEPPMAETADVAG
jgi:hypothetical protein